MADGTPVTQETWEHRREEMPKPGAFLGDGNILYHYRTGKRFLSRDDWAAYIRFLDGKFKV